MPAGSADLACPSSAEQRRRQPWRETARLRPDRDRRRLRDVSPAWPASTAVELARWQFALTTLFHFIFVPLTLGLAPLLAVMQTLWHRSGDEKWLRLTRFFGTLFLINFAIGVATGLVMEFQFGMNWSAFSTYVGDVFGPPLAIEGIGAFMLEATFIGLWIFGWDRALAEGAPRDDLPRLARHLALGVLHPRCELVDAAPGRLRAQLADRPRRGDGHLPDPLPGVRALRLGPRHPGRAGHRGGLVLGVACWHLLRGRNVDVFRGAAKLAIVVAAARHVRPAGIRERVRRRRHRRAADEDRRHRGALGHRSSRPRSRSSRSAASPSDDQTPSFDIEIPGLLSFLATNSFKGEVVGINELQSQYEQQYGPGNYVPDVRLVYWSMRVMAYLGTLLFLLALWGGWLLWRKKLEGARWFQRAALVAIALPLPRQLRRLDPDRGGRQPWVVYGLLKTEDAVSGTVSAWTVGPQPGRVRLAVRGARNRRLLPHAPLRPARSSRGRPRRGGGAAAGAGVLR